MALIKEQRTLDSFKNNPNIKAVRIFTKSSNFERRYDGSINYFFKTLKNSLQSVNGVSNRQLFKDLSGAYFSIDDSIDFEIIVLYDTQTTEVSEFQWKIRLKKLLGHEIKIEFGNFFAFAERLGQMIGIVRKGQVFGEYYKKKHVLEN